MRMNGMRQCRREWSGCLRRLASGTVAAAALLTGACSPIYFAAVNSGLDATGGSLATLPLNAGHGLRMDRHTPPAGVETRAVVVFFYGGSWRGGDRADYRFVGETLAEAGYLTLIPDYRVYPQARFPAFMHDAAAALRAAFDIAEARQLPVAMVGHSAGAHIAALLATDARYLQQVGLQPEDLLTVVGIAGPYDFLPLTDPDLIEVFGTGERWPDSQPINFVDGDEPPFLLLQGLGDRVVEPRNSRVLAARLRAAGVAVSHLRYDDVGHIRILTALRWDRLAPTRVDLLRHLQHRLDARAGERGRPIRR